MTHPTHSEQSPNITHCGRMVIDGHRDALPVDDEPTCAWCKDNKRAANIRAGLRGDGSRVLYRFPDGSPAVVADEVAP